MLRCLSVFWGGCLAWACWLGLPGNAAAQDLVVERAVYRDAAGRLSVDALAQAAFSPAGPVLHAGYTDAVHWLRLRIRAPDQGTQIALRIRPAYLDEIVLFAPDPARAGHWLRQATGDTLGSAAQGRPASGLGFVLDVHAPVTTVYLRLQTTSSSLLYVEALTPYAARSKDLRLHVALAVYLGLMVALLLWAANDFLLQRQRVVGLFLVSQLCYSVYALAVMGFLPMLFPQAPAGAVDVFTSAMVCLAPLLSLLFHRVLLGLFGPPRPALRVLEGLVVLNLVAIGLLCTGWTRQALQLNALVVLLAAPTFLALAFLARRPVPPGLRVIRCVYSLQAVSLMASMLPLLGWLPATEWNLQATLVHGFISAFLMFLLLHLRSRKLAAQAQQAAVALQVAQEQLALKHRQKQQQERFMAMLTHELKTPMAVVRMALGKLQLANPVQRRAQRALSDMEAIVTHCQQADQLEQQQLVALSVPCHLEHLLADLLADLQDASDAPQRLHIHAQALPALVTDPQLLRVVLGNLVGNALKYAAPGSVVQLHAEACVQDGQPGVRVAVRNPVGLAGVPDAAKVFEKYYRSPGARRSTGSGLGLYLVKSYMQLLGGGVTYAVEDGQVEFTLWIPC